MIDPKELRIGNILSFGYGYVSVTSIKWDSFEAEGDEVYPTWDELKEGRDDCDPADGVGLTEEILKQCGFEEKYTITEDQDEIIWMQLGELIIGDRGCQYDGVEIAEPKYLHQLQNLYFALTQKELQINLSLA